MSAVVRASKRSSSAPANERAVWFHGHSTHCAPCKALWWDQIECGSETVWQFWSRGCYLFNWSEEMETQKRPLLFYAVQNRRWWTPLGDVPWCSEWEWKSKWIHERWGKQDNLKLASHQTLFVFHVSTNPYMDLSIHSAILAIHSWTVELLL